MTLTRRSFVGALAALAGGCQGSTVRPSRTSDDHGSEAFDVVDLSHSLGPSSPYIHVRGATFPFRREPIATIPTRGVYANRWELTEHIGTHLDAPCHFDEHASCVDSVPLADLFAAAVVIDVSSRAEANADTELSLDDLSGWQANHGAFPPRCAVLLRSGWDRRWPSQERFANSDAAGVMHFPGFSRPPWTTSRSARRCSASARTPSRSIRVATCVTKGIGSCRAPESGHSSASPTWGDCLRAAHVSSWARPKSKRHPAALRASLPGCRGPE